MAHCIIVGASHAGVQLALSLRQEGWEGPITLIGDESDYPYHRPPLSKDYLTDEKSSDHILLRPAVLYDKQSIRLLLNSRATQIDRGAKTLVIETPEGKETLNYDKLALCVGSSVRRLQIPGSDLDGIHYLRTITDVEAIRRSVTGKQQGLIIGGGYIGLEMAAMLRKLDKSVTVIETAPRILSRVTSPEMAAFFHALHTQEGVSILTHHAADAFTGKDHVDGVQLGSGEQLAAEFTIVGIGIQPNCELAESAGLAINNGIVVDEFAATEDPNIVAAGDCTNLPHPLYGRIRLESVPNATEQAKTAAATLCGKSKPYGAVPWFWSDQYNCKLQIAGVMHGYDQVIINGIPKPAVDERPSFSAFYLREGTLIAADCVNRPKDFMRAKRWIGEGYRPGEGELENLE